MDKVQRKNITRRMEALKVRHDRVVVGYFEAKYPEAFKEAEQFYQHLDSLYPEKKDIRRTNEFAWLKTGFPKKFYPRKTQKKEDKLHGIDSQKKEDKLHGIDSQKKEDKLHGIDSQKKEDKLHGIDDNMVLNIPLMNQPKKTNGKVVDMSEDEQIEVIIEQAPVDIQPAEVIIEQASVDIQPAEVIIEQSPVDIQPAFPILSDKVIGDIVQELREDPDIEQFFDDMDIDFEIDEQSPLEMELLSW